MKRRDSLKFIGVGSITAGMIMGGCKPNEKATPEAPGGDAFEVLEAGRQDFEIARDKKLLGETFFDAREMATIAILADIIIPKDEVSGSATEAGVPDFIEFIVKDMPRHQLPLRGGLRWLDLECYQRFEKAFADCSPEQRLQIVDDIAYPKKVKPGLEQGAAFFDRMRDLTATGFYTSEIGIQDLGYAGNMANKWQGPPAEELAQFGFK
jgi:hypothetical protein